MSVRITNFGLNAVATTAPVVTGLANFESWIWFSAIGTGTTAPAQTDTALVAETARVETTGGFAPSNTFARDTVANRLRLTHTSRRVFAFTASFNLTEFGHFTSATGANCVFRDLFRTTPNDPNSAPVVISVVSGQELHIIRTLVIEVPWQSVSKSFTITNLGLHTGNATAFATTDANVDVALRDIWPSTMPQCVVAHGTVSGDRGTNLGGAGHASVSTTLLAYTAGSFNRVKRALFGTGAGNFLITGIAISSYIIHRGEDHGYKFVLTTPANIDKRSTHSLELDFRSEWSRL